MEIEKFAEFRSKKVKLQQKTGEFQPLADDILMLKKLEDGNYEKIKEPVEIVQITGIITDPKEIKKLQENMVPVNLNKENKVGDIIWLTAVINYTKTSSINSQNFVVIECRIINMFKGLNAINRIK